MYIDGFLKLVINLTVVGSNQVSAHNMLIGSSRQHYTFLLLYLYYNHQVRLLLDAPLGAQQKQQRLQSLCYCLFLRQLLYYHEYWEELFHAWQEQTELLHKIRKIRWFLAQQTEQLKEMRLIRWFLALRQKEQLHVMR